MAKKRRKPTVRQQALKKAEGGLTKSMNAFSRLLLDPPPNIQGMANKIAVAADDMREAFFKLGVDCFCNFDVDKPKGQGYKCECVDRRYGGTQTQHYSGFSFDGVNCRDSQGNFVPVMQCNPPWARKRRRASSG
jgi:hypothetical protein